jgi:hypothetical protein
MLNFLSILVTGRGGVECCEMLRIPYSLDNRLKDGGKFVSLMRHSVSYSPVHDTTCLLNSDIGKIYSSSCITK